MASAQTSPKLDKKQLAWRAKYGPWALVTGASDGIGLAIAQELARRGLNLVLVARRQARLEEIAAELEASTGVQTRIIPADLSDQAAVGAVIEATSELDLGLFAACAGFGTSGHLIEASLEQELNMMDVNCRAVLVMSQHFGRRFAAQGHGGIVLMSSLLAFQGVPRAAHYAATKAYIQTLAEGLSLELGPQGVDILASAPGPTHSGFAQRADLRMGLAIKPEQVAVATLRALGHKTTVRPGWLSKFLEGSLSLLPRSGRARALGRVMQGMTGHQQSG